MGIGTVLIKLLACFVVISVYIKLSANSQLAPMTASDQVGNIVMGALAGGTFAEEVSVWMLVGVMSLWGGLQILVRAVKYRSERITSALDGERVQLMRDGRLLMENFDRTKLAPEDFVMALHERKIHAIDEVRNAWYEPSGQITVDRKPDPQLSRVLVSNGGVLHEALAEMGHDKAWLHEALKAQGYDNIHAVFLAEWHDDALWVYPRA